MIGWFSVRGFKKTIKPLDEIAKELGVEAILSGSIQKQGTRTRVIAELTEIDTKKRLWGDDFEYDSKDILLYNLKLLHKLLMRLKPL